MTEEVFIPFNQLREYIMVKFVTLSKTEEGFSDVMVVEYNNEEFDLTWDYYNSYYKGYIIDNGKMIEGYIV